MHKNSPKSFTLYLLVAFFVSIATEPGYAGSSRTPTDTLRPGSSRFTRNDSTAQLSSDSTYVIGVSRGIRQKAAQPPKNWYYTLFGVIGTGIAILLTFVLGFAFTSAPYSILSEALYPMGILVILLGVGMTIVFIHRLKRYKARKALENSSTGEPASK